MGGDWVNTTGSVPAVGIGAAEEVRRLVLSLRKRAPSDGFLLLEGRNDAVIATALAELEPNHALALLERFPENRRAQLIQLDERLPTGLDPADYAQRTVGHLMSAPNAVFPIGTRVAEVVGRIRELATQSLVVYAYAVDEDDRLRGLVTMRDLLLADPDSRVEQVMLFNPFSLRPDMRLEEAMHETARRHYPLYPVCDSVGRLIGTVGGAALFEAVAYEISAQSGRMVGVDAEERLLSPWWRSFRLRHTWLQVNLLTVFASGFVVSLFQNTLSQLVLLAAFLPVVAGQTGSTSSQTLAVTLRGMALDEYKPGMGWKLLRKEAWLGCANGLTVGIIAALAMTLYAKLQGAAAPAQLGLVVLASMTLACTAGGAAGVAVPVLLMRLRVDPSTASSIFLSTLTDIVSMGLFLGLATSFATG